MIQQDMAPFQACRRITAFTPGQVQRRDDFHWVGPHATKEYVDTEMQEAGQEVARRANCQRDGKHR